MKCPLDEKGCYRRDSTVVYSRTEGKTKCRHGEFWSMSKCPAQMKYGFGFEKLQSSEVKQT